MSRFTDALTCRRRARLSVHIRGTSAARFLPTARLVCAPS